MGDEFGPVEGYDRLGRLMGELPETAIFRRFGALSAEDLLYRQAELVELENTLREYQKEDKQSGHEDRQRYGFNWDILQYSANPEAKEGNDSGQWNTILEIREKLEAYRETNGQLKRFSEPGRLTRVKIDEALLRHSRVLELRRPLQQQVKSLDTWMQRPSMGNVYLTGADRNIWSDPNIEDMVALKPASPDDNFTTDLTLTLVHRYHSLIGRRIHV
jgi:hypothetical protein